MIAHVTSTGSLIGTRPIEKTGSSVRWRSDHDTLPRRRSRTPRATNTLDAPADNFVDFSVIEAVVGGFHQLE
jgi:hypothetical protein